MLANVDCTNAISRKSDTFDDARADVICPTTHSTMVSCGGKTYEGTEDRFDGAYIDTTQVPARCYAQNAGDSNGVIAYARCCNFIPNDVACQYLLSSAYSGNNDDDSITTHCGTNSYQTMLGCSTYTQWALQDGSFPGQEALKPDTRQYDTHDYPGYNYCTAVNAIGGGGVKASLACCQSPTYTLSCITRYGHPAYPTSTVSCPADHFMSGCSGWSRYKSVKYVFC